MGSSYILEDRRVLWIRRGIPTRVGSNEVGTTISPSLTGGKASDGGIMLTYNTFGLPMPKHHRRRSAREDFALFMGGPLRAQCSCLTSSSRWSTVRMLA